MRFLFKVFLHKLKKQTKQKSLENLNGLNEEEATLGFM